MLVVLQLTHHANHTVDGSHTSHVTLVAHTIYASHASHTSLLTHASQTSHVTMVTQTIHGSLGCGGRVVDVEEVWMWREGGGWGEKMLTNQSSHASYTTHQTPLGVSGFSLY